MFLNTVAHRKIICRIPIYHCLTFWHCILSDRRPFSVADFAERVWGVQHAEVTAKLKGVIHAYKTAMAADREFARGKADPITNLSLALAEKAIAEAAGGESEA